MATQKGTPRTCPNGHRYYKSSDCPVCPVCEQGRAPVAGFMRVLSAPARRALEGKGISTLMQLAKYSEKEILALHGVGPGAIPKMKAELEKEGLGFRV